MKGWRTILVNVALLAAATPEVLGLIPPATAAWAIPVINLFLRAITSTPIGRKE